MRLEVGQICTDCSVGAPVLVVIISSSWSAVEVEVLAGMRKGIRWITGRNELETITYEKHTKH